MILLQATHQPGRHCASSGARDLALFHGLELSEAMCFGLGAGLGLRRIAAGSPSRLIHTRSRDMEAQFFRRIGQPFEWSLFADAPASHQGLIEALDQGRPALLQSDIRHLPYFNTNTSFPGHVIVAWGHDPRREVFWVSDTERPELQEVPFAAMARARFSDDDFFRMSGNMYAPASLGLEGGLEAIVAEAVVFCSQRLLTGHGDDEGLPGLDGWIADMAGWGALPDWRWTARLCYQMIERRGTGGGAFRLMYAEFLEEAAAMLPRVGALGLPALMGAAAETWTTLALALKAASEQDQPDFGPSLEALRLVRLAEAAYHRRAVQLV